MHVSAYLPTAEMPVWNGEEAPPRESWELVDYGTGLGPYVPYSQSLAYRTGLVPYAHKRDHQARHFPSLRKRRGGLARWARSTAREIGEFWVGAFQPIKEAW